MGEKYDYGKWIESEPLGFNKRIVRYNPKHNVVTYAGVGCSLKEFKEVWLTEMNGILEFINKCENLQKTN